MDYKQAFQVTAQDNRAHFLLSLFFLVFSLKDEAQRMFVSLNKKCPAVTTAHGHTALHWGDCTQTLNLKVFTLPWSKKKKKKNTPQLSSCLSSGYNHSSVTPLLLPAGLYKIVHWDKMQPVSPVLNRNQIDTTAWLVAENAPTTVRNICLSLILWDNKGGFVRVFVQVSVNASCVW